VAFRLVVDFLALAAIIGFFVSYLPREILNDAPATGGDTGSHFWPLYALVKEGLPNFRIRMWNPGNLGGEPLLVHYFPFPFLTMAALSLMMPLGTAFNVGTILPMGALPLSVYFGARGLGMRFPGPALAATLSLIFLYNESFSMWGGNVLSTLAGQFAHGYALNFMLLAAGAMGWEIRTGRSPRVSALLLAAVATSHAYVFLGAPAVLVGVALSLRNGTFWERLIHAVKATLLSVLLACWFLFPMADNQKWTTPYSSGWPFRDTVRESFSWIQFPVGVLLLILPLWAWWLGRSKRVSMARFWKNSAACLAPVAFYVLFYVAAEKIGVINARAVPQIQLFLALGAGAGLALLLRRSSVLLAWGIVLPISLVTLGWVYHHVRNFEPWAKWNYSGWEPKQLRPAVKGLAQDLKGDFSSPRVVYEHNTISNGAGTERVFEMLPYFAGRSTLESVYMQANVLAPAAFHVQALVSKTPSCPFGNLDCPKFDLQLARPKLELMGVGDLILITPEVKDQTARLTDLKAGAVHGPWQHFNFHSRPSLVEVFSASPRFVELPIGASSGPNDPSGGWKRLFYRWFTEYTGKEQMIVANAPYLPQTQEFWANPSACKPEVQVKMNELLLRTPCPGKPHFLKFAFHPTWRSSTGDPLFLVSPGFIGIVPSQGQVAIRFGESLSWTIANWISTLTFTLMFATLIIPRGKRWPLPKKA
jgi:hypothetical protein